MDSSLQIVVETKTKKCIDKCIICQKPKDNKGTKSLQVQQTEDPL